MNVPAERRAVKIAAGLGAAGALAAGVMGYWTAEMRNGLRVQTGTAHTAVNAVSIEGDDGTYWMPLDVTWTDDTGGWHTGGRPECVPPTSGVVEGIRFAGQRVDLRGGAHLQVVAVFCDETPTR